MTKHLTLRELLQKLESQEEYLDKPVYAYCCQQGFHSIIGIESSFVPFDEKDKEGLAFVIDEAD